MIINGFDTNDQTSRDQLRSQGYYIDNTGVYAPNSGQRSGDTFSGSHASQNQAPNNVFLPIQNGTPMSPSNARTFDQRQPGVSYMGDSDFGSLFGPGSYFFQSGGPSHYGWMQPGANASDPASFMKALFNYGQLTNSAQRSFMPTVGSAPNYSAGLLQAQRPTELGAAQTYFNQGPSFTAAALRPMLP